VNRVGFFLTDFIKKILLSVEVGILNLVIIEDLKIFKAASG